MRTTPRESRTSADISQEAAISDKSSQLFSIDVSCAAFFDVNGARCILRTMTSWLRKLALTAHVTFSVSWLGAVAGFLALAVAGLISTDEQRVRSACMSMDLIGWLVIVPLCLASLLSGLVQALGTPWGLFRHYWVLLKLVVTGALTILLMVHMQPTRRLAAVAAQTAVSGADLHQLQIQLAVDAAAALVALLAVVTLAVYKPRGVT